MSEPIFREEEQEQQLYLRSVENGWDALIRHGFPLEENLHGFSPCTFDQILSVSYHFGLSHRYQTAPKPEA